MLSYGRADTLMTVSDHLPESPICDVEEKEQETSLAENLPVPEEMSEWRRQKTWI